MTALLEYFDSNYTDNIIVSVYSISTYSLTYYDGIAVFTKALIMKQCTVLRVLGLWRMLYGTTVGWFSSY